MFLTLAKRKADSGDKNAEIYANCNIVYRKETEDLGFEMQVLSGFNLKDRLQRAPFCSGD